MSEQVTIVFDATELDNFEMCAFRWHLYHHLNLRPKNTPSYFEKGSLLHHMLEGYYKRKKEFGFVDQDALEAIIEEGRIESVEFDLPLLEVSATIFQVREYARYYEDETVVPVFVEQPMLVKIFEDEDLILYLSGKPDLVFHYRNQTDLIVMDHKGVSREFPYSPLRNQFLLYTTAVGTDTFILNKVGYQKTKKPKDRFLRATFVYPKEIQEEWKQDTIMSARQMALAIQHDHYPKNRTSCEKFNGCFLQRYCTTRPQAREFLIGPEYIVGEPWDVTGTLEKEKEKEKK